METETSQPVVATKKSQNIIRVILFMLREGIAKSKLMLDLHLLLKRGKLAAAKAISNTLHHHRRGHRSSFVSPSDYEFSCSNSPAAIFPAIIKRHNKNHHHHSRRHNHHYDDVSTVHAIQKMLEMLNNSDKVEASPLVALPGFGKSPIGKQLRITDSPFPLKDEEGDHNNQVDLAAEEFIKRFYKDLNLQQKMAAIESPYHRKFWDR